MTWRPVSAGLAYGLAVGLSVAGCGADGPSAPAPSFGLVVPRHDVAEAQRVGDLLGCPPVLVGAFVKLDSDFDAGDLAALGADGQVPLVTLEPWSWRSVPGEAPDAAYSLQALATGRWDRELSRLARVLADHRGEVMVRFAHEMNADWYPWGTGVNGNTPGQYVRAWRHVHDLVAARAPGLTWVWAPLATWWPEAQPLEAFWPGDDYVDVVGVTGYGRDDLVARSAEATFGAWYREVSRLTARPKQLSEVGASGRYRRAWIDSLAPFLTQRPDIDGLVWFNTSPQTTGATGDYRVDDDPGAAAALTKLLDDTASVCTAPSRRTS